MAAVPALGDAEKVDAVGICTSVGKELPQQSFPHVLLALLVPSVVLLGGYLGYEIERWGIVEAFAEYVSCRKFVCLRAGTVQIEHEGPSAIGAFAFGAEVEGHEGVALQHGWQVPI